MPKQHPRQILTYRSDTLQLSQGALAHTIKVVLVRRVLGLFVTVAIGLLPVVPPEHVHEVEEHGHTELVVHRHLEGHGVTLAHDHAVVDHDDAPIATLDQDYIVPAAPQLAATFEPVAVLLAPTPFESRLGFSAFVERLIHGPPRAPAPDRGPPSFLAS